MYANRAGDLDTEDNDYTNEIVFRTLPPLPMTPNKGPTETAKTESCFQKNWSIACKVSLFGVIAVLCIILIVICALFSAASVQVEKGKHNTTIQVNELQFLKNKLDQVREISTPEPKKEICPITWTRVGDACYSFSVTQESWFDALASCTRQNSKLLILTSREEVESLRPLMSGKIYWIGLIKFISIWMWLDGTPLSFSFWSPNEPNNVGGNEFCVEMKSDGWNDLNCVIKMHYICKK
ncbi:CD209 antigen-like protein E [Dendropsophus ebraccatus]|uniref:CD209 antigen-like protein E n=1 Tax=Dendropsophus ebraccatus TaxID=150705 RepID=UPI0038320DA8